MTTANGAKYSLLAHQQVAVDRAMKHGSYALFMETGTGKTLAALHLLHLWRAQDLMAPYWCSTRPDERWRALVVCPLSCIESVWRESAAQFTDLRTVNLWKARKTPPARLEKADLYVINYESLASLDPKWLAGFDLVILDESTKIKNPRAQITKFVLGMRKYWRHRLVLSGLPAPNQQMEYWSQMAFINPRILGDNFYAFRAINFFNVPGLPYLWRPKKEFLAQLPEKLARQAMVVKKADCLDLPAQTYTTRTFVMAPAVRKAYDQMLKANITIVKGKAVLGANELAKIMKLRQFTSGFAVDAHGEAQEFKDDGKLKLLLEVLDEIGDRQVIIWVQFHKEIEKIRAVLGEKCAVLAGTESQGDKELALERFKAGMVQYLIAHPRTAGHGLTLVNSAYAVYYSLSYSLEEYKQSQDRIHRIGQKESVTYIHLLAEKSIDQVIFGALRGKTTMSNAVLDMVKELAP